MICSVISFVNIYYLDLYLILYFKYFIILVFDICPLPNFLLVKFSIRYGHCYFSVFVFKYHLTALLLTVRNSLTAKIRLYDFNYPIHTIPPFRISMNHKKIRSLFNTFCNTFDIVNDKTLSLFTVQYNGVRSERSHSLL